MVKTASFSRMQQGDAAPAFSLAGIDGRTYSLEDFRGKKGIFVLFMCNHCPYVKARMDEVVSLHQEFGERIAFVSINASDPDYSGEGLENMKAFAKEREMTFPYLMDEDGAVAKAYGATCTPDPFLFEASTSSASTLSGVEWVNAEGKLVFHGKLVDALEPQDVVHEHTMHENMRKLLAGEPIEPWFDPSVGCSIKFKS